MFHSERRRRRRGSHFPEFTGKSVWKGWRLKISIERRRVREKGKKRKNWGSRFTAFPPSLIRISKSKQKGDPRSWVVSTRRWSLSRQTLTSRVAAEKKVYEPSPIRQSRVTRHWLTFYGPESGFARLIHMPATLLLPARVSFSLNIVRRIFECDNLDQSRMQFRFSVLLEILFDRF